MAPRRQEKNEQKMALLNVIKEKKSILFGKFSSDLDNREKNTAWGEIVLKAKSLGLATANRDIAHVRDKMWSVWKSRALEKRDNRNKTGTGGGKAQVMTEVDKLIIDIIGSETVAVDGMEIGESGAPQIPTLSQDTTEEAQVLQESTSAPRVRPRSSNQRSIQQTQEKNFETIRKSKLQCNLLELTIYKTRLEALKLEREMCLPQSTFTMEIFE